MVESGIMGDIYFAETTWLRRNGIPGLAANDFNTNASGGMGSWFFDKAQSGGGPLIDLGVHRLDLALWLMGYPEPAWVMGSTYAKIGPGRAEKQSFPVAFAGFSTYSSLKCPNCLRGFAGNEQ